MSFSTQGDSAADAEANHCFGCGAANAVGLHLQFVVETAAEGVVTATAAVQLSRSYEGGRGYLHGGIIATLMDEAMSKLNKPLGVTAVTRQMEVEYLRPSLVDAPLTLVGRHVRRDGRKLFHAAELSDAAGVVLARATGLFLAVAPSG